MPALMNDLTQMVKRIAFQTTSALKDCCVEVLADTRPKFLGATSKCMICDNRFKTVEADVYPISDSSGRISGVFASKSGSTAPITVKQLLFSKKRFDSTEKAKDWSKTNGFLVSSVKETAESIFIRQAPDGWFDQQAYIRTIRLADGVLAEVGPRRQEYKDKKAGAGDILGMAKPAPAVTEKVAPVEVPYSVAKCEDGTCPPGHPVKWAGKCWSTKAAAKGFPQDVIEKPFHDKKPMDDGKKPSGGNPFAGGEETMDVPEDGKCPEGWTKKGDKCVKAEA